MKGLLTTLFIIWVVWKLVKPALDKYLQGVQDRMEEQIKTKPPGNIYSSTTSSAGSTRPVSKDSWELGEPIPGEQDKGDLEQWFREALERKRRLEQRPDPLEASPVPSRPTRSREVAEPVSHRPQKPHVTYRQTTTQRVHPRPDASQRRRREVRTERRHVVMPAERMMTTGESRPMRRRQAEEGHAAASPRRAVPAGIPCIGTLDRNDVRRGIILAEILGPPKALRDIDSHVV